MDDIPAERDRLEEELRTAASDMEFVAAESLADAERVVQSGTVLDVVLLDLGLPDSDGLTGVERMLRVAPATPLVVLTGVDDERLGLQAVRLGAQDYLVKGRSSAELASRTVRLAVEREVLARQARSLASIEAAGRTMGTTISWFLEEVVTHLRTADPYLRTRLMVQVGEAVMEAGDADAAGPEGRWKAPLSLPVSSPVRGELVAWSVRPGDLRPCDVAFLHRVAEQVGGFIHGASMTPSLTDSSRQLRALHAVAEATHQVKDTAAVVERVAEALAGAVRHGDLVRVEVALRGVAADAGRTDREVATVVEAAVEVAGDRVGVVRAAYVEQAEWLDEERQLVERTAALLGTWLGGRLAEEDRTLEARWLARLTETTPVGVAFVDPVGRITYANPEARRIFGEPENEPLARTFDDPQFHLETVTGDPLPVAETPFARVRETGDPVRDVVHAIRTPDGIRKVISVNATPVLGDSGRFDGMVAAILDVTDRHATEAELAASQARLQMMLSQLPAVVWTVGEDMRLTSIRGAGLDALDPAPAVGDSLVEYFVEGEDSLAIQEHRRALAGEQRSYSFWHGDVWWQIALEPLTGEDGDLLGVVGLALDTTAEKRALDEAEHERARYQSLFDHSTELIVLLDDEGRLVDVNPAGCELLGRSREDLVGRSTSEFLTFPEGDVGGTLRRQLEVLGQRGHVVGTCLVTGSDGETREVEYSATAGLRPGLHVAIARDVTLRRQVERALANSEQRFRSVAEAATEGIFRLRLLPDRAYEYVNPALGRITGFRPEAVLSDPLLLRRRTHPDDVVDDTKEHAQRLRFERADGEWRWLELRQVLLLDDHGHAVAVQGVVLDVTAEQQRADALREALQRERKATEELRRVAAMKDTFLRAVSHELRTPVTVVSGLATTLREHRHRLTEGDVDTMFQRLETHADRLRTLLEDLLDIDRLTTARNARVQRELVQLDELVRRTAEEVELGRRTLQLELTPTTADVEPAKVQRIVHNLLANAARHTPEGTTVHVTTRHDESGAALVTVADDGPGIPPELRESILEPFVQGPASADAASPGTGIGLSIVNEFTRLHGGHVAIDDGPRGGTSITVTLPRAGPTERHARVEHHGWHRSHTPPSGDRTEITSKKALLAISRSIEGVAKAQSATDHDTLLVGLFQEPEYRAASEHIYRDVALQGGHVLLCHIGDPALPDLATLALPPGHPLGQEWTVLFATPGVCAALVAHDTRSVGRGATIESARLFRFEISTAPEVVAAHLRRLVEAAGDTLGEDQRQRLLRAADRAGTDDGTTGARASQLHESLQEHVSRIGALQDAEPLAMTDPRTGAHTPAFLEQYLDLTGPRSPDLALIGFHITSTGDPLIDLDHARAFAELVRDHTGPGDVLVHHDDERWHLLLPSTSEGAAEQLALHVLGTPLAQRLADDGANLSAAVTASTAAAVDIEALDRTLAGVADHHGALAHVEHRP